MVIKNTRVLFSLDNGRITQACSWPRILIRGTHTVEVGYLATLIYVWRVVPVVRTINLQSRAEIWLIVDEGLENARVQFQSDKLDNYRFR